MRIVFYGFMSQGKKFERDVKDWTIAKKFKDLDVDFYVTGTNLSRREVGIFSKETTPEMLVSKAIRISASMPGVFKRVRYDGDEWTDGSLFSHLPVGIFEDESRPTIIYLIGNIPGDDSDYQKVKARTNLVDLIDTTIDAAIDANVACSLERMPKDAILVHSHSLGYGVFDFEFTKEQIDELIQHGYDKMRSAIERSLK